jgi:hypothetical protein
LGKSGAVGETGRTQDQEEIFEKAGVLFQREGGKAPARRLHGLQLQVAIDHECSALTGIRWGIIQGIGGQFLVPDIPTITYVPLLPTLSLCGGGQEWIAGAGITKSNVVDLNRHLLGPDRREADAAIAEQNGRDAVPGGGREDRVPGLACPS